MSKKSPVGTFVKGLRTDNDPLEQPDGTYRYAFSAVSETREGEDNFISNELSNEQCVSLPAGYTPVGSVNISENNIAVFLAHESNGTSEIGILKDCEYTQFINDSTLEGFFDFGVYSGVSAVYRLVRGCEDRIYFTTPTPFVADLSGNTVYKSVNDFSLQKTYQKIPNFTSVKVQEEGNLDPGSYNIAVQMLDEDLNPTEWLAVSHNINIYNDNLSKSFETIRGSTTEITDYRKFPKTNKSIVVTLDNFDENYLFYRLAFIQATSSFGTVNNVYVTPEQPIKNPTFSYTGVNAIESTITESEIRAFTLIITKAQHIEQIENKLILSNVQYNDVNFCSLQKYASQINTDLKVKTVILNTMQKESPKFPTHTFTDSEEDGTGYMPGEIYSLGIEYKIRYKPTGAILDSPAYHIPGRNENSDNVIFKQGSQVYPMSTDNKCEQNVYTDNGNCESFWGCDATGQDLKNTSVRHHRFPLRSDYNIPFVQDILIFRKPTYRGFIFGLQFSNIIKPVLQNPDYEVIGYNILRQERTEENKTIIDSGVLLPITKDEETGGVYESYSNTFPEYDNTEEKIATGIAGFLSPVNLFLKKENKNFTSLVKQGEYQKIRTTYSNTITEDVGTGSSYDPEVHKNGSKDTNGFQLNLLVRESSVQFRPENDTIGNIKDIAYLKALEGYDYENSNGESKSLYNVSSDNRIGVVVSDDIDVTNTEKLDYVYLKKDAGCVYTNFRTQPYYKETQNTSYFTDGETANNNIWHGDIYISPMRYFNSMYYDFYIPKRPTKRGVFKIVIGVLVAAAAIILAPISGGTSLIAGSALITGAASAIAVGLALSTIASGIRAETVSKIYNDLYEDGLRDTVDDIATRSFFGNWDTDDQVRYQGESIADLWFESPINMFLRQGSTALIPDFLNSPAEIRNSNGKVTHPFILAFLNFRGEGWNGSFADYNRSKKEGKLDAYLLNKTTNIDFDQSNGYLYQGYSNAEIYDINEDYRRVNKTKFNTAIGLEYDCCSGCSETFPHRSHASETSFQEELTDNFRTFLPNNYTDLPGETGRITNVFKLRNTLYYATEKALWSQRANIQERITNEIVSFIGTGEFFSLPPVLVKDDNENSAGTLHKWSFVKSNSGAMYMSENEGKVYMINGQKLEPISSQGEYTWFKNNSRITARDSITTISETGVDLFSSPFKDGFGYNAIYDQRFSRYILTKHDREIQGIGANDVLWVGKNKILLFPNYKTVIKKQETEGAFYKGISDGKMIFLKNTKRISTSRYWNYSADGNNEPYVAETSLCNVDTIELNGLEYNLEQGCNKSWTKSWSDKDQAWTSYHPYYANMYWSIFDEVYSFKVGKGNTTWKHNIQGKFQEFYGDKYPFVLEEIQSSSSLENYTSEHILFQTQAQRYLESFKSYVDVRYATFNKLIAYNRRQSTGLLSLAVKDEENPYDEYFNQQTVNNNNVIIIDRNERDWTLNELRDYVVNYDVPLFLTDCESVEYLDKVPNSNATDINKDWTELELMRDKYLAVRYIFDNLEGLKLTVNYTYFNTLKSSR